MPEELQGARTSGPAGGAGGHCRSQGCNRQAGPGTSDLHSDWWTIHAGSSRGHAKRDLSACQDVNVQELEPLAPLAAAMIRLDPRGGILGQADVEAAVDYLLTDSQAPCGRPPHPQELQHCR